MSAAPPPPQALFRAEQKSLHTCAEAISNTLHHNWTPVSGVITAAAKAGVLIGSNPTATLEELAKLVQRKHHHNEMRKRIILMDCHS